MRSKDHYGNDQLSGQQVQDSLRRLGIKIDKSVLTKWMKAADMIGRGIYSIPGMDVEAVACLGGGKFQNFCHSKL